MWAASSFGCGAEPAPPSFVLIVLDTVRRDYTGAGPAGERFSPNLDRLAEEGTRFTNAWANGPWTIPSHASLFTGLFPLMHGCNSQSLQLDPRHSTLAEALGGRGYQTAAFYSNPWLSDRMSGVLRGFQTKRESEIPGTMSVSNPDQGGEETLRNLADWLDGRDRDRPFFLFINLLEAHLSYDPRPLYRVEHLSDLPGRDHVSVRWGMEFNSGLHPPEEVDWTRVRRLYGGDVHNADQLLGSALTLLREAGLYEETVVIVTSDHGENLGDHGLVDHQFGVFETLLAVPLVVRAPDGLEPGVRHDPVMLSDVFATVARMSGLPPESIPPTSSSLASLPENPMRPVHASYAGGIPIQIELMMHLNPSLDQKLLEKSYNTVRLGTYRLTRSGDGALELHDMSRDPNQNLDIAGDHPVLVEELAKILDEVDGVRHPTQAGTEIDPRVRERLRSLGYAN